VSPGKGDSPILADTKIGTVPRVLGEEAFQKPLEKNLDGGIEA
jgi:hypothetical protein